MQPGMFRRMGACVSDFGPYKLPCYTMVEDLILAMAGAGGDGVISAGESLLSAVAADGYGAMLTKSFGSQIRGGESSCRLRVSTRPVPNPGGIVDVAVAFNWEHFLRFGPEIPIGSDSIVIYEEATGVAPGDIPIRGVKPSEVVPVPIDRMATESSGRLRAKNTVVMGLLCGWFDLAQEGVLRGMRKKFGSKGAEILAANESAFEAGVNFAKSHPLREDRRLRPVEGRAAKILVDGNDICAAAAIFAGCRFFGGYPITPSSEIMQFFNREIWKYGGSILQAEDEIAGIGAVVGASFAGAKAMTATSGPGLSLKTEILGLATIAELPLVCVNVQRGGPSTGLPTKTEQADLFAAAFSAHGDVARPILAPVGVADTFGVTVEAFNIAESYQTPVIILSDQEISQRKEAIDPIDTGRFKVVERSRPGAAELDDYVRFRITETGVSPMSHPGMRGGEYLASGIEHDEKGAPSVNGAVHARMNEKRFKKLEPLQRRSDLFELIGPADAPIGLIAWGSVAGVALEAVERANRGGIAAKLLIPKLLYPVAIPVYEAFFKSLTRCMVIEQSHQGQLHKILRMWAPVPKSFESIAKDGSNPFSPEEIEAAIRARDVCGSCGPNGEG